MASLGVRSVDGESDLERRLSAALRSSASTIAGWSLGKRDASLDQMMLAIGCEEPDAPCLGEVAKTLAVQRLVFGSVTSASGGYDLTINQYDTADKQLHTASSRGLKPAQLRGTSGREAVLALLSQLNQVEAPPQAPAAGQLRIHGDMPNAEIAVDGQSAGSLDEQGNLTLELTPGKHVVRAAGQAFAPAEEKLALVEAGQTAQVELSIAPRASEQFPAPPVMPEATSAPERRPSHTLRRAFGWASLGIGTAFAFATIYSWVRIERINDDSDFLAYRGAWPRAGGSNGVENVCPRAARGELAAKPGSEDKAGLERRAHDLCREADTLQALQYVFLGGALVGAGVGTYLLVSARRLERREAQQTSLSIAPRFGFQSASLEARLRF
ncbi:MAG TPA: hypothetical protein VFX59_10140 [Polyangiales bacterium]|nr:hypothetical protein [Polyangiales bacterium]